MASNKKYELILDIEKKELTVLLKDTFTSIECKLFLNTYESFIKQFETKFNAKDFNLSLNCRNMTLDYSEFLEVAEDSNQLLNQKSIGAMIGVALLSNDLFNKTIITVIDEEEPQTKEIFDIVFHLLKITNYEIKII